MDKNYEIKKITKRAGGNAQKTFLNKQNYAKMQKCTKLRVKPSN